MVRVRCGGDCASGLLVAGCGTGTTVKADSGGRRVEAPSPAAQSGKLSFAEFDKKHCSIATAAELATALKREYAKWGLRPTMKPTADSNSCSYPVKGNVRYGGGAITIRHRKGPGALVFLHICEQEINDGKPESYAKPGPDQVPEGFGLWVMPRIGRARAGSSLIALVVLAMLVAPRIFRVPVARFLKVAMARGAVPVWTVEASSRKVTSRMWWEEFSMLHSPRMSVARVSGSVRRYVRRSRVAKKGRRVSTTMGDDRWSSSRMGFSSWHDRNVVEWKEKRTSSG